MDEGGKNAELVRRIVVLAHNLEMDVIAEGVETEQERELLQTYGCDYAQGFLFAEPLTADAAGAVLRNWGIREIED